MKKLFICVALFTSALLSCTSDNDNLADNSTVVAPTPAVKVDAVVGNYDGGSLGLRSFTPAGSRAVNVDNLYMEITGQDNGNVAVPATPSNLTWKYVNLICNTATGLFHGDNGWAVKDKAEGTLDNNRKTYSWFYNDQGQKQNVVQNDQGLLLTGDDCDLTKMTCGGTRAVVNVGDEWFANSYSKAQLIIDNAMKTEKHTAYYQLQNGGDNTDYPYDYYLYKIGNTEYKVVLQDYDMQNGSCVIDGNVNDNVNAPWAVGHGSSTWPTDGDQTTMDHNVIVVPTQQNTVFNGRNINAHIFAPGKDISILGGGAPSGLVIADNVTVGAEIHGSETPEFGTPPVPSSDCDLNITVNLDISGDYVVQADDFAIHNGDKLYENVKVSEHTGVTQGNSGTGTPYVKVNAAKGELVELTVENICELYPSYIGKTNSEGRPYINEAGVLTLEVFIWPGTIEETTVGNDVIETFKPNMDLGEGYIIGEENAPKEYAEGNKYYSVQVSGYKGFQGLDSNDNNKLGWSYVKVSIHITPRPTTAE